MKPLSQPEQPVDALAGWPGLHDVVRAWHRRWPPRRAEMRYWPPRPPAGLSIGVSGGGGSTVPLTNGQLRFRLAGRRVADHQRLPWRQRFWRRLGRRVWCRRGIGAEGRRVRYWRPFRAAAGAFDRSAHQLLVGDGIDRSAGRAGDLHDRTLRNANDIGNLTPRHSSMIVPAAARVVAERKRCESRRVGGAMVRLEGVGLRYGDAEPVLQDVSFSIAEGGFPLAVGTVRRGQEQPAAAALSRATAIHGGRFTCWGRRPGRRRGGICPPCAARSAWCSRISG